MKIIFPFSYKNVMLILKSKKRLSLSLTRVN